MLRRVLAMSFLIASTNVLIAQEHAHTPRMTHPADSTAPSGAATVPVSAGQAAYAAIGEIARLLEQDPATDWTKVNLEKLRQHLIDMDEVTMRSVVRQENIGGGARFVVTGQGRTLEAIRRMTQAHGGMMSADGMTVRVDDIASGVRMTVVAAEPSNATAVARIRGLGFIGLMTSGDHHGPHHLAMARGTIAGHGH
ncbi:MAG: hypothetical protein WD801_05925 [Gemmatimonadaceae bacterium]